VDLQEHVLVGAALPPVIAVPWVTLSRRRHCRGSPSGSAVTPVARLRHGPHGSQVVPTFHFGCGRSKHVLPACFPFDSVPLEWSSSCSCCCQCSGMPRTSNVNQPPRGPYQVQPLFSRLCLQECGVRHPPWVHPGPGPLGPHQRQLWQEWRVRHRAVALGPGRYLALLGFIIAPSYFHPHIIVHHTT
jgi:hypothetical protein